MTPEIKLERKLPISYGAIVEEIMTNSPAQLAGIQVHDIIMHINDESVTADNPLTLLLSRYCPDTTVTLRLLSGTQEKNVSVTLGTY